MDFSIFKTLLEGRTRLKAPTADEFAGLTTEEVRELRRMREEVLLARELAKARVMHMRAGLM